MTYSTNLTKKGQLTIPKSIREKLKLDPTKKLSVDISNQEIRIKSHPDILDLAGTFKPKRKADVLKAREALGKAYERR